MSDKDERPEEAGTDAKGGSDGDTPDAERMDLPKWNRARVKRKQAKGEEQDSFQAGVRKAGKAAITQAPVVIGGIVLIAAVIAGVVWFRGNAAEERAEATRVLAAASGAMTRAAVGPNPAPDKKLPPPNPVFADEAARDKSIDDALSQLQGSMSDTDAATAAQLLQAARKMRAGEFSEAKATYEGFLQAHADHPLSFLAKEGKALALEASGDVDAAVAAVDEIAPEAGGFYRDQALFHKARMLEGQGKADEALAVYKTYVEEYPLDKGSLARDAVVARLEELAPDLIPEDAKKQAPGGMGLPPGLVGG